MARGAHGSHAVPLILGLLQGEVGQSKLLPFTSLEAAKKDFEKKFWEKTKNSWAARENFVAQPGKYTLIEVQPGAGQEVTLRVSGIASMLSLWDWDIQQGQQGGLWDGQGGKLDAPS